MISVVLWCLKYNHYSYWLGRFVSLPVSEPTGGSMAAAALMMSTSGMADISSSEFGSVLLTCDHS